MRAAAATGGVDLKAMGFVNQTGLGQVYAIADCLVLPSDSAETWGLVVNEALATGLPVVVSDAVGCVPDLLRDGTPLCELEWRNRTRSEVLSLSAAPTFAPWRESE